MYVEGKLCISCGLGATANQKIADRSSGPSRSAYNFCVDSIANKARILNATAAYEFAFLPAVEVQNNWSDVGLRAHLANAKSATSATVI